MRNSHLHRAFSLGVAVTAAMALSFPAPVEPTVQAAQAASPQAKPAPKRKAVPGRTYEEYQVPAGNTLPIELRSRLSSNTNQSADHVEGRLLRPIIAEGVELVPAGATVIGTVSEAEAAGPKKPGRIAFTFHVIQHPGTGSRATIKASVLEFQSQPPAKGKVFPDVVLEKGTDASVLLLAPLLVRLPIE